MREIRNYSKLLGYLYQDEPLYTEEIAMIEQLYLYPALRAFVDDGNNISRFFIVRKNHVGNVSAFLKSDGDNDAGNRDFILEAAAFLDEEGKSHLQTGEYEEKVLEKHLKIQSRYTYMIMTFNKDKFSPSFEPEPVRIGPDTPYEDLDEISHGNADRFREEARNGIIFAHKIDGKWASLGGAGIKTADSYYLFISTEAEFRGRGLATALLSHSIREILNQGKRPLYALDQENEPSLRLARKMGFEDYGIRRCLFAGEWKLKRTDEDSRAIPDSSFLA